MCRDERLCGSEEDIRKNAVRVVEQTHLNGYLFLNVSNGLHSTTAAVIIKIRTRIHLV